MNNLIHDIINDPREYLPVLVFVAVVILLWAGLCGSGLAAVRAKTPRRKFWFSLAPLVFGLVGVWAQIPLALERDSFHFRVDLRWFFVVPLALGIAGVALWWRTRHESVA